MTTASPTSSTASARCCESTERPQQEAPAALRGAATARPLVDSPLSCEVDPMVDRGGRIRLGAVRPQRRCVFPPARAGCAQRRRIPSPVRAGRCDHHVQRVEIAVHEPITGQRATRSGGNPVESSVEISEEVSRPSEWERQTSGDFHHRRTLESLHHEVPVAGVVHLVTRVATRPGVVHDRGLGFESAVRSRATCSTCAGPCSKISLSRPSAIFGPIGSTTASCQASPSMTRDVAVGSASAPSSGTIATVQVVP